VHPRIAQAVVQRDAVQGAGCVPRVLCRQARLPRRARGIPLRRWKGLLLLADPRQGARAGAWRERGGLVSGSRRRKLTASRGTERGMRVDLTLTTNREYRAGRSF